MNGASTPKIYAYLIKLHSLQQLLQHCREQDQLEIFQTFESKDGVFIMTSN